MRISDWSSVVCSSDLPKAHAQARCVHGRLRPEVFRDQVGNPLVSAAVDAPLHGVEGVGAHGDGERLLALAEFSPVAVAERCGRDHGRSEEHTSELQSLMRISYAVFCLKKKKRTKDDTHSTSETNHQITHHTHTLQYTITMNTEDD